MQRAGIRAGQAAPRFGRAFGSDPEGQALAAEAQSIQEWFGKDRFKRTTRTWTAEDVAKLRGTFPGTTNRYHLADKAAEKAWDKFNKNWDNKEASWTFGCTDPVQVVQMAKYLDTIYVSGWQSSSTCSVTNEPGPDLADYPMNTVPTKVDQLFRALMFHDRKQKLIRTQMTPEERQSTPPHDLFPPIIADGDTGHGGLSAVMKLVKLFVEAGAAGVHLEDQKAGTKKCGHMGGKVLVSTQEHAERLKAARLQCDIMGTQTLIVARTDAEAAQYLDNNIDPRDQPFIMGTRNKDIPNLVDALRDMEKAQLAPDEMMKRQVSWGTEANAMTFGEAVTQEIKQLGIPDAKIQEKLNLWNESYNDLSHVEARELAKDLGVEMYWSWYKPRTREGYYRVLNGVDFCIQRAKAFAPHADLLWMETDTPNVAQAKMFADGVHAKFPNQLLSYNLSPSFNWDVAGLSDDEMASFTRDIGKLGFVWQFCTLAGLHSNALMVDTFTKDYAQRGMRAYVEKIQRKEREYGVETLTHQKWSGALVVDYQTGLVNTLSSTGIMSKGVTEDQFKETKSKLSSADQPKVRTRKFRSSLEEPKMPDFVYDAENDDFEEPTKRTK
ncbi:Isocitrate lyase 1 [Diplonema papillatum]|nr:Isocitrate lyase 1 [Diplonema papillatum]